MSSPKLLMSLLAENTAEKRIEDHAGEVVITAARFCGQHSLSQILILNYEKTSPILRCAMSGENNIEEMEDLFLYGKDHGCPIPCVINLRHSRNTAQEDQRYNQSTDTHSASLVFRLQSSMKPHMLSIVPCISPSPSSRHRRRRSMSLQHPLLPTPSPPCTAVRSRVAHGNAVRWSLIHSISKLPMMDQISLPRASLFDIRVRVHVWVWMRLRHLHPVCITLKDVGVVRG